MGIDSINGGKGPQTAAFKSGDATIASFNNQAARREAQPSFDNLYKGAVDAQARLKEAGVANYPGKGADQAMVDNALYQAKSDTKRDA